MKMENVPIDIVLSKICYYSIQMVVNIFHCTYFLFSVALNFQTAGVEMDLNDGLFSQNGHCGYVLKPAFMRNIDERFDPENPQNRDGYKPLSLSIQVQT